METFERGELGECNIDLCRDGFPFTRKGHVIGCSDDIVNAFEVFLQGIVRMLYTSRKETTWKWVESGKG